MLSCLFFKISAFFPLGSVRHTFPAINASIFFFFWFRICLWETILYFWFTGLLHNWSPTMVFWQAPFWSRQRNKWDNATLFIYEDCIFIDWHLNPEEIWFHFPPTRWIKIKCHLNFLKSRILFIIPKTREWFPLAWAQSLKLTSLRQFVMICI